MYIVTNTIKVKTDYLDKMEQVFLSTHTMENMEEVKGFKGIEIFKRHLEDEENASELVVLSRWDSKEDQQIWVKSESFNTLHGRKPSGEKKPATKKERPVLGNEVRSYYSVES